MYRRDPIGNRCGEQIWANAWSLKFNEVFSRGGTQEEARDAADRYADLAWKAWAK